MLAECEITWRKQIYRVAVGDILDPRYSRGYKILQIIPWGNHNWIIYGEIWFGAEYEHHNKGLLDVRACTPKNWAKKIFDNSRTPYHGKYIKK